MNAKGARIIARAELANRREVLKAKIAQGYIPQLGECRACDFRSVAGAIKTLSK